MDISYPNGIYKNRKKTVTFFKRGMAFEEMINQTNNYYLSREIACIHKKPTPIQVVKVDYKQRSTSKIIEAYYCKPSTTDYNGVYKSKYIDFEAKQTQLNSLPLKNIHSHQINHMENVLKQGGICFLLVYFVNKKNIYFICASHILNIFNKRSIYFNKKSLDINFFVENGYLIDNKKFPVVDYIKILDRYYLEK